jgi:hypothetical protein
VCRGGALAGVVAESLAREQGIGAGGKRPNKLSTENDTYWQILFAQEFFTPSTKAVYIFSYLAV